MTIKHKADVYVDLFHGAEVAAQVPVAIPGQPQSFQGCVCHFLQGLPLLLQNATSSAPAAVAAMTTMPMGTNYHLYSQKGVMHAGWSVQP